MQIDSLQYIVNVYQGNHTNTTNQNSFKLITYDLAKKSPAPFALYFRQEAASSRGGGGEGGN